MFGIVGAFELKESSEKLRNQVLEMSRKIRHRGPDWSGIYHSRNSILAHERLAIVDPKSGKQPIFSKDNKIILAANGEIYNHVSIREQITPEYSFLTASYMSLITTATKNNPITIKPMNKISRKIPKSPPP